MLASMHVTEATVQILLRQRALHAENEHIFGPLHVQQQAYADLRIVNQLLAVTPAKLRHEMHRAAASVAELFGWIAQDSGDARLALTLTDEALSHLNVVNHVEPAFKAMPVAAKRKLVKSSPDSLVGCSSSSIAKTVLPWKTSEEC